MRRRLSGLLDSGWGLLAQALSLASTFLPVFFQRSDALVVLVTSTAIATIVTPVMSLAAQVRIPSARTALSALMQTRASFATSAVFGVLVLVSAWAIGDGMGVTQSGYTAAVIAALCVSQSIFTIGYSILVRDGTYRNMMLARLAYAGTTFALTFWIVLEDGDGLALCIAAAGGYATGFLVAQLLRRRLPRPVKRQVPLRFFLHHLWRAFSGSLALTLSMTIGALAGQIGALVTPLLGSIAGAWALLIRVMSGFQTLGVVVIGSSIDARIASAARSRDDTALARAIRVANLVGAAVGTVGVLVSFVAVVGAEDAILRDPMFLSLVFALIGFVGSSIVLAPIGRILGLVGRPVLRLAWDSLRCAALAPALLIAEPASIMTVLALGGLVSLISYYVLLRRATRAHGA